MAGDTVKKNIGEDNGAAERIGNGVVDDVFTSIPEVEGRRRSGLLPLILVPLAALALLSGLGLLLIRNISGSESMAAFGEIPLSGVENAIVRAALEDLQDKRIELNRKDAEIRRYQDRILDLDRRLRMLQDLMDETLQLKERDLLQEIELILTEERNRLEGLGRDDEQIERALERLRDNLDSEYDAKMVAFRNEELRIYEDRLETLQAERETLRQALDVTIRERLALAQTLETEESDLLSRLYEEKEALGARTAGIREDLEILRESQTAQNYWLDELAGSYLNLLDAVALRDRPAADRALSALNELFTDEAIAELPGIEPRNAADREILRFFEAYVETLESDDLQALITDSRRLADQAEDNARSGRWQEAEVSWRRLGALWALMDRAMQGRMEARARLLAADLDRYGSQGDESWDAGEVDDARAAWSSGLERIPDPVGREVRSLWNRLDEASLRKSLEGEEALLTAFALEREETARAMQELRRAEDRRRRDLAAAYEDRLAEQERDSAASRAGLQARIADLEEELAGARSEIRGLKDAAASADSGSTAAEASAARDLIDALAAENAALANRIDELEQEMAERDAAAEAMNRERASVRWQLYGVIVQRLGDILVVEPLTDQRPAAGAPMRVMRSVGTEQVYHLADGVVVEAGQNRATARVSSVTEGAEIYGTPKVDDLVYVTSP